MGIDLGHSRIVPYKHQVVGAQAAYDLPYLFLTDEMGAGKTKQVIDAQQALFHADIIDHVLVIAPASVRDVWFDMEWGELRKHLWNNTPSSILLWHNRSRMWTWAVTNPKQRQLQWTITNYDYIRQPNRYLEIIKQCDKRTTLVLDESSTVKNYKSQQAKACYNIRQACGRVILLNGTPISNSPADLYMQGRILDPSILDCSTWFHFRSRYAVMGGWENRQVVKWRDLEDIQRRFAPYTLRRLKQDCIDLPPKLPAVTIPVALTPATWEKYKQQRDQMVTWLGEQGASVSAQAITKIMRLAQITSGFIGGVQKLPDRHDALLERPAWLPALESPTGVEPEEKEDDLFYEVSEGAVAIGREKLDAVLEWLGGRLEEQPNFKFILFCRFRAELLRYVESINATYPNVLVGKIWGGQTKDERSYALRLLDPRTAPAGPAGVCGTPSSGSMGLNLAAAWAVIYPSNDYSLKTRLQSEDRAHRPGQTRPVSYFDIVATGPKGQRTIDHAILKALRKKENLATFTARGWLDVLREEIAHAG